MTSFLTLNPALDIATNTEQISPPPQAAGAAGAGTPAGAAWKM